MADVSRLIGQAVEYGMPAFEIARLAYDFSYDPTNPRRVPVNSFAHRRILSDHRHRLVTTPNHDTLYSSAVIDLSSGPVTLQVPAFGARYHSLAFMDAYTNNFAYLGTRATGGGGGSYVIVGPGRQVDPPPGARLLRAPGNHISILARILVEDASDYAEVHRLQDRLTLSGPAPARSDLVRPVSGEAENFVTVVNRVLRDDPPPEADRPLLKELAAVGIGGDVIALTPEQRQWWRRDFARARSELIAASKDIGPAIFGWQYSQSSVGNFGTDYRTRAVIAIQGMAANIPAESVYALALTDADGRPLDERRRYRLHLLPGQPPADAFWSLSIYEVMPHGGMYFADNALHRYALGSLNPGLECNDDGSLDILIQKEQPAETANWLPTPPGTFAVMMRAYLPRPEMLDGRFRYPGIERLR
ncbi:MAG TPA: DUF1254 domain-containing protein [Rhizomicrobium sp.]|nr:DUF1254 domain-containing protein [Rhizomicrobium sp.]